jgi:hypothetical protein
MSGMTEDAGRDEAKPVLLALAEAEAGSSPAPWIGPIVALGAMARRYVEKLNDRQLVIVLSVPRRDFAAVLLGCGWIISAPEPKLRTPEELLATLVPGTPVRAMTNSVVFEDVFEHLTPGAHPEAHFEKWHWMAPHLTAIAPLANLSEPNRDSAPVLGALGKWRAEFAGSWHNRVVSAEADLALIGTASRLHADLDVRVVPHSPRENEEAQAVSPHDSIGALLLPRGANSAVSFSTIYSAARLADELPLPSATRAVILDGYGAIKYLAEIEAPFVFSILDRSIANETSAELLVHYRNSRGEPVALTEAIGWRPPPGVEAMAFTTRL